MSTSEFSQKPAQPADNKILLHVCCAICSAYPISYLKDMGYDVIAYFYNPNIHPKSEYLKRLDAQKNLCCHLNCELVEDEYEIEDFFERVKGFENEPEKGARCDICFEIRLKKTAQKAQELGINNFTTSIVISPHKNFRKLTEIGEKIADEVNQAQYHRDCLAHEGLNYVGIDFKKGDGFLKSNRISKELGLYRQNYCGCKFSIQKP